MYIFSRTQFSNLQCYGPVGRKTDELVYARLASEVQFLEMSQVPTIFYSRR